MIEMQTSLSYLGSPFKDSLRHWDFNEKLGSQPVPYSDSPWEFVVPFYDNIMFSWSEFDSYATVSSAVLSQPKSYEQPQPYSGTMFSNFCSAICNSFTCSHANIPAPEVSERSSNLTPMEQLSSVVASSKLNPEADEFWPTWWNALYNNEKACDGSMSSSNLVNTPNVLEEGLQCMYLESIQSNNANAQNGFCKQQQAHQKSRLSEMNRYASDEATTLVTCKKPVVECSLNRAVVDHCRCDGPTESTMTGSGKETDESGLHEAPHNYAVSFENKTEKTVNRLFNSDCWPKEPLQMPRSNSEELIQESISPKDPSPLQLELSNTSNNSNSSTSANCVLSVHFSSKDPKPSLPINGLVLPIKEAIPAKPLYAQVVKGTSSTNNDLSEDELERKPSAGIPAKVVLGVNEDDRSGLVSFNALPASEEDINNSEVTFNDAEEAKESTNSLEETFGDEQSEHDDSVPCSVFQSSIVKPFLDLVGNGRRRNLSESSSLSSDSIVFSDSCAGLDLEEDTCCSDISDSCHRKENRKAENISLQWIQVDFSEDDDEDDILFTHSPVVGLSSVWLQEDSNVESNVPTARVDVECGLLLRFDDSDEDGGDDEDDGDHLSVIIDVNQRWQSHCNDPPEKCKTSTKVRFKEAVMIKEVPADEDRKGPWATYALDSERFRKRIDSCDKVLSPMLCPAHREKVYRQRFEGSK